MASALSPTASPTMLSHGRPLNSRRSPTPPLASAQPQSKRDKRRTMLADRLTEMVASFDENHGDQYYAQLSAIQCDINLVIHADPHSNGPLDDDPETIKKLIADARTEVCKSRAIAPEAEDSFQALAGRGYRSYVEDINAAMEERDAELTMLHNTYQESVEELHRTNQYKIQLAHEEHQLLSKTLRERLIQNVTQKKARLLKDKEQLDIADSNSLLLNPNQFSLGNPSSPSGNHSNRKTRNTRGRPGETEDVNSGVAAIQEGNKRKRKTAFDDIEESPAPGGRALENSASAPYRDARAKLIHSQFEAPLYSIDRLFTEKELAMNINRAHIATSEHFNRLKLQGQNSGNASSNSAVVGAVQGMDANHETFASTLGSVENTHGPDLDIDSVAAAARAGSPAVMSVPMAPSASQQGHQHSTRSTQRNAPSSNPLADLANAATSLPAFAHVAPIASLGAINAIGGKNANPAAPTPPTLTEGDTQSDMALMGRPVGDSTMEALIDSSVSRVGAMDGGSTNPATGGGATVAAVAANLSGHHSGGAETALPSAMAMARGSSNLGTAFGGVLMSKASSMTGISDAGGPANGSVPMDRSVSANDFASRRR